MGPGVDVVDRLTDRPVAMTICYLGGSRSISVTLSIAPSSNLSVHLRVFFHSLIGSSSSTRPLLFLFFSLHHLLQTQIFSLYKCLSKAGVCLGRLASADLTSACYSDLTQRQQIQNIKHAGEVANNIVST